MQIKGICNNRLSLKSGYIIQIQWSICLFFAVVTQQYVAETHNVYVIIGNSALFKCEIPSFVADFVTIDSWNDNDGSQYFSAITNNHGKPNQRKCIFLLQIKIAVHHKNKEIGDK